MKKALTKVGRFAYKHADPIAILLAGAGTITFLFVAIH